MAFVSFNGVTLAEGAAWPINIRPPGLRITCCAGQIWITEENGEDIVLANRQVHLARKPGKLVIQALTHARACWSPIIE